MKYRMRNGKREYIYGDPPRIVRFCLGPFQDAVLQACPTKRSRNRPASRRMLKAVAVRYGVDYEELLRWRERACGRMAA